MARQSSCFPRCCSARPDRRRLGGCAGGNGTTATGQAHEVWCTPAQVRHPGNGRVALSEGGTPATQGASQGLARGRPSGRPARRGASRPCALRSTRPGPRRPAGRVSRHESWPRTAAQPHPACPACVLGCKHTTRFLLRVAVRGREACWWTLNPQRTRCLTQCFPVAPPQSPAKRAWR